MPQLAARLLVMRLKVMAIALVLALPAYAQYPGQWQYAPAYPPPSGYVARPPVQPSPMPESMLAAHNAVRAQVGVPPLAWSNQLSGIAQQWADHLIATNSFSHRPNNQFGENLYTISGGLASPAQVVALWAEEARGYDIRTNTCTGVCGHYTQIVWAKTRAVGCAVASNPYRQVWVCNYDPPGNWVGFRPY